MQTSIRFNSLHMNPLVRLHFVVPYLQFKRYEFTINAGDEVGSAFRSPTSTMDVNVVNAFRFQIFNAISLQFTFSHPNIASKSIPPGLDETFTSGLSSNPEAAEYSFRFTNVTVLLGSLLLGCLL